MTITIIKSPGGKFMRRILIIATLILMSAVSLQAADLKVGHFDLQRLIAQSDAGKDAREKYLSRAKNYQDELNGRAEKLKKIKEEVGAEAKGLKENEKPSALLVEKDKEYAVLFRDYQRLQGGYQDELKVYDAELTRKVLEELTPVLRSYAVANKYDYLFRLNETLAYALEKRDVTDELVKAFNKALRK
jgi:outer membrane protein